jgi:hypothetical protein
MKILDCGKGKSSNDDVTLLPLFSSCTLLDAGKKPKSHVINAGTSIWGLDFAPSNNTATQYLAVSGYKSIKERHVVGVRQVEEEEDDPNMKNCIQIWSIPNCIDEKSVSSSVAEASNAQKAELELCILHDFGCVYDVKWCPYGGYETEEEVRLCQLFM